MKLSQCTQYMYDTHTSIKGTKLSMGKKNIDNLRHTTQKFRTASHTIIPPCPTTLIMPEKKPE